MLAHDVAHALARLLLERGRIRMLECTYARIEQRASLVDVVACGPGQDRVRADRGDQLTGVRGAVGVAVGA